MNEAVKEKDSTNCRSATYTLQGSPIPLARARHGNYRTWDSQKHHKLICGITLTEQHNNAPLFTGPLLFTITFYMQIPHSSSLKKKAILDKTPHHIKPDLSNMLKFYEDVAATILFADDAQIAYVVAQKIYSDSPRTEFTITEIK